MNSIGIIAVVFLGVVAVISALGIAGYDKINLHAIDKEKMVEIEIENGRKLNKSDQGNDINPLK